MNKKQEHAQETRQRLLDAALEVTQQHGAGALTLDAVARDAGVSKGGLLHHFRTKEALIEALLQQLFAEFEARAMEFAEQDEIEVGRWLRAYVRATFDPMTLPMEVSMALLPLLQDERLLDLVQTDTAHWRDRLLNDGLPRGRAMVILHAADAFWIDQAFKLVPSDTDIYAEMRDELLKLTTASAGESR